MKWKFLNLIIYLVNLNSMIIRIWYPIDLMISVSAVRDPESTAQSRIVIDFPSTAMLSILGLYWHQVLITCWFYATCFSGIWRLIKITGSWNFNLPKRPLILRQAAAGKRPSLQKNLTLKSFIHRHKYTCPSPLSLLSLMKEKITCHTLMHELSTEQSCKMSILLHGAKPSN